MRPGLEELFTCGEKLRFCKNSAHFVNVESLKAFSGIDVDSDGVEEFSNDEDERIYKKGLESGEIRQKK